MKKIAIYQALWGMEQLPTKDNPYSIDKQLELIKENGFEGVLNFIDDSSEEATERSYNYSEKAKEADLKLGLSCNGFSMEDIKWKIDYASEVDAEFINIMVKSYFVTGDKAVKLLEEVVKYGKAKEVTVFVETHRASITQDLLRTVEYVEKIKELELTIDLSHYILAGEFTEENLGFYGESLEVCFDKLLRRTGSIHLRITNGEQIQIPLNRVSKQHLEKFVHWWKKGIAYGYERLDGLSEVPVIVELGPEDYQQKIWHDNQWIYDCDRLEEALKIKALIR